MNDGVLTTIIVWASPFLVGGMIWFVINHISDVKESITEVKGHIGGVKDDVNEVRISVVRIQKDLDYLKNDDDLEEKVTKIFENNAVKVIKNARKKFE